MKRAIPDDWPALRAALQTFVQDNLTADASLPAIWANQNDADGNVAPMPAPPFAVLEIIGDPVEVSQPELRTANAQVIDLGGSSDGLYRITLNGTDYDHNATGETATQIRDALIALINPVAAWVARSSGAAQFVIAADQNGAAITIGVSSPGADMTATPKIEQRSEVDVLMTVQVKVHDPNQDPWTYVQRLGMRRCLQPVAEQLALDGLSIQDAIGASSPAEVRGAGWQHHAVMDLIVRVRARQVVALDFIETATDPVGTFDPPAPIT